jgi:hypothetical protein
VKVQASVSLTVERFMLLTAYFDATLANTWVLGVLAVKKPVVFRPSLNKQSAVSYRLALYTSEGLWIPFAIIAPGNPSGLHIG